MEESKEDAVEGEVRKFELERLADKESTSRAVVFARSICKSRSVPFGDSVHSTLCEEKGDDWVWQSEPTVAPTVQIVW